MKLSTIVVGFLAVIALFSLLINLQAFVLGSGSTLQLEELQQANEALLALVKERESQISLLNNKIKAGGVAESSAGYAEINRLKKKVEQLQEAQQIYKSMQDKGELEEVSDPRELLLKNKLKEYVKLHNDILEGRRPKKYVQCILINGWGNVFQEAVSCFLFALVTDRAAIFNVGALDGYMPFRKVFSEMPVDIYNMNAIRGLPDLVIPRYDLQCLNFTSKDDAPLITIHLTYDYYVPMMMVNPYHSEDIWELLPGNWYKIVFGWLFKLPADMQETVNKFKEQYFGDYTVGIQIRVPTYAKSGEKDHKGMPVPHLYLFAEAAEYLSRYQNKAPYENVVWFLATQSTEYLHELRKYYGKEKIAFYNGTIITTFESNFEGQVTSLITWWLLGEADEVVTTEASSYGTTSAARTGLVPVICNHHKFCFRKITPEPCQDTPFLVEQPFSCLEEKRKFPHQYVTAPDNSCGYYKWLIYTSKEHQEDSWKN